jgi:peroxiredoxin family protein
MAFLSHAKGKRRETNSTQMSNNEKNRKSEDANYFQRVQKRLAKLDHAECIELARELTKEARKKDEEDMSLCACMVEELFGINKQDLYSLIDAGAIEAHESEDCSEPILRADDIRAFFEQHTKTISETSPFKAVGKESEDPRYFSGLQKRLSKLDYAKCIRLAQEQTENARKEGAEDVMMCACSVRNVFGIRKRDIYALAEIGALQAYEGTCEEPSFLATDMRSFFERAGKIKASKEKQQTSCKTEGKKSGSEATKKAM